VDTVYFYWEKKTSLRCQRQSTCGDAIGRSWKIFQLSQNVTIIFTELLNIVGPLIKKHVVRQPIPARTRLEMTMAAIHLVLQMLWSVFLLLSFNKEKRRRKTLRSRVLNNQRSAFSTPSIVPIGPAADCL